MRLSKSIVSLIHPSAHRSKTQYCLACSIILIPHKQHIHQQQDPHCSLDKKRLSDILKVYLTTVHKILNSYLNIIIIVIDPMSQDFIANSSRNRHFRRVLHYLSVIDFTHLHSIHLLLKFDISRPFCISHSHKICSKLTIDMCSKLNYH